ncbi:FlxA-like family protein [Clostridium sp. Mt-5]|uniref:FlxA-like family protein n=1 Tax=Clostridium moutaii TaxID=3240932 RepID=A0ABV4BUT0_9CLOT
MISSISSSGIKSISSSKTGKSNEDQIKILQHQKAAVQKQIDNIKNGSLDTRTKQELIKPLQGQIQSIEAQI